MRMALIALCGTLLPVVQSDANEPASLRGDYLEARTADVYTGPCFSNAEVFIVGDRAVMAWKVTDGSFQGVDLSGLCVAAALRGSTTFSEDEESRAEAVVIIDQRANSKQADALLAMAKELAGDRLSNIVAVKTTEMDLTIESIQHDHKPSGPAHKLHKMPITPPAYFDAVGFASIATRTLEPIDCICGNEVVAYPPLSEGVEATPAYTLSHKFSGLDLKSTWNDPNCRSSFVGHFAL